MVPPRREWMRPLAVEEGWWVEVVDVSSESSRSYMGWFSASLREGDCGLGGREMLRRPRVGEGPRLWSGVLKPDGTSLMVLNAPAFAAAGREMRKGSC